MYIISKSYKSSIKVIFLFRVTPTDRVTRKVGIYIPVLKSVFTPDCYVHEYVPLYCYIPLRRNTKTSYIYLQKYKKSLNFSVHSAEFSVNQLINCFDWFSRYLLSCFDFHGSKGAVSRQSAGLKHQNAS